VVPNPFGGEFESFGHHNNAMLRRFLDTFGFDYEFASPPTITSRASSTTSCCAVPSATTEDHGHHAAHAGRGAPGHLFAASCRFRRRPAACLYVPMKDVNGKDGTITYEDEDGDRCHAAGHRRQREAAVEAGLRRALGGPWRRLRNVRQGPRSQHAGV
jgi:lysyl-tRNA synthetase class 1